MNLSSTDLSQFVCQKSQNLEDLRTTKLTTNKATNILEGFTRVIFNVILDDSFMDYKYEISA